MFRMTSLQTKVFGFFVALLLLVQALSLWTVYKANQQQQDQQVNYRLDSAVSVFQTQFQSRGYYLEAFAETVARDYGLKGVFDGDTRSFLVALNNHRKRIDADMAIGVDGQFKVLGQLLKNTDPDAKRKVKVGAEQGELFAGRSWLGSGTNTALYQLDGQIYQLTLAPLKVGGSNIGWVGFGYLIDTQLAGQFSQITGLQIDFLQKDGNGRCEVFASSNPEQDLLAAEQRGRSIIQGDVPEGLIGTSAELGSSAGMGIYAAIYGSRSNLLEAIQKQFWQLMFVEGGIIAMALLAAYFVAASISRPVLKLVKQAKHIASGNYHTQVDISERNELGQLAREFNHMQQAILDREKAIEYRAYHDPLTELPNQYHLRQLLDQLYSTESEPFTLFYIDVRRTKEVNDTLGYEAGDQMIQEVAKRLATLDAKGLNHMGSDEFVLLVEGADQSLIDAWQQRLAALVEQPICGEGIHLHLQINAGIARAPEDASSADQLLQRADAALSHGKRDRVAYQCYHSEMDADAALRLSLVFELKQAIEDGQLVLFYQPKLNLATGQIGHLEALVRWQHPKLGMVPPDAFISIAEQTGQIDALSRWVIEEAARQYNEWQSMGLDMSIAVNISAENLRDSQFTQTLSEIWHEAALPSDAISLEVTESAVVVDPESAIAMLCEIRDAGIKLSIDDYGTGYSSLAQLKQLPVQELKIDRSFVDQLVDDPDDQIIVRSTINLGHEMGLSVVAEGIEDAATLEWLREHGCNLAQGYFISRPLPAAELLTWLQAQGYTRSKAIS